MADRPNVLLVGTDFGEASVQALGVALDIAPKLEAEAVLAHVYKLPSHTYPGYSRPGIEAAGLITANLYDEIARAARKSLDELAAAAGGLRTILTEGDAATRLLALADEIRPLMLLLGTTTREGLARVLLGSVAERLVRTSPVPVLTVCARPLRPSALPVRAA